MSNSGGTPWFTDSETVAVADFWQVWKQHYAAVADATVGHLSKSSEFSEALKAMTPAEIGAQNEQFLRSIQQGLGGDWSPLEDTLRERTAFFARSGTSVQGWCQAAAYFQDQVIARIVDAFAQEPARLAGVLSVMHKFVAQVTSTVALAYVDAKEQLYLLQQRQAERAVAKFARLSESGIIGILVCDLVGNIREANDCFLQMFGYSRDEVLSGAVRWAEMTPPEWRHLDDNAVEQLQACGTALPWEKEYFRKDGSRVPILVGVAMLNDAECIAFVHDITERKRLEEIRAKSIELEAQNRRIQEANRLKSEFLANMSHELRTPLNSIIGFADLLYDGEVTPDSPQHREFLGDILKSGRHLLQLINNVLDLAKVESGKIDFHPEAVELGRLAAEVTAVLRTVSASKSVHIDVKIDPDVDHVNLDPARLKQVLYNYVSNALKFTPDGGKVIIRARSEGKNDFRLEVEDTGIGIAPEDIERLFVEFQQLNAGAAKKFGGTGLGLALTKRIVEAQGGTVGVRSAFGHGSVFSAVLPRDIPALGLNPESKELREPTEGSAAVLVVEDDARDRRLLVQTLSLAGYGVEAVSTGREAIASCKAREFDAITLDLLLPDMTGLDVLHRIRVEGKNRDTPVIVVSVVAERGVLGGFTVEDYLHKPINGRDLVSALERTAVTPEKSGTILVVDDDPAAIRLMGASLQQMGYRIECRSSGEEGLSHVALHRPVAVILDLMMPGIGGFEFLTRFRSDPENRLIPVIIWTMKDLTDEDHRRLRVLSQKVVAKGEWTPTSLVSDLRVLLSRRREAQSLKTA